MNKKLFILVILLFVLLTGCGKEETIIPENKQLTLEEYVKNSEYKNVISNLKCSALDNYSVVKSVSYNLVLLSDGYLYTLVSDKATTYQNGEQCKKYDSNIKISKIFNSYYYISDDNKVYTIYNDKLKLYDNSDYFIPNDNTIVDLTNLNLSDEERAKYKSSTNNVGRNYITTDYTKYVLLRNDGNIYETIYKRTHDYNAKTIDFKVETEKVLFSKNNYGFINSYYITHSGSNYTIHYLSTNNGFYNLKTFENEECKKYEDIACEQRLVLNDGYLQYNNQIKYIDHNLTITNDNSVFPTKIFIGRTY